jgi:hypothetical protein
MADVAATTLDGNAVAGALADVFGEEMATATGTCASCGAPAQVATFVVFTHAPGVVARCPACASILMVLVAIRGITCMDLRGLAALNRPRCRRPDR